MLPEFLRYFLVRADSSYNVVNPFWSRSSVSKHPGHLGNLQKLLFAFGHQLLGDFTGGCRFTAWKFGCTGLVHKTFSQGKTYFHRCS